MAGLLSGFQPFGGALQGPLGSLSTMAQDNPYTALLLGMGLLSGTSTSDAFANGAQGLLTGSKYDTERKTLAEQQKALGGLFTGHWGQGLAGAKPAIAAPSGTRELFKAFPDQASQFALQSLVPKPTAGGQSTDYNDYLASKKDGSFKGTFPEWKDKYGQNRSAEDWAITPQPLYGSDNVTVTGMMRLSNRGGIQWMDAKGNVLRTYHPGDPDYPAAAATAQAIGAAPPAAPGTPTGAATPGSAPTTATPPQVTGSWRPIQAVKGFDTATGTDILTGGGASLRVIPKQLTQAEADKAAGVDQATDLKTANNASLKATSQKNSIALMRRAAEDPNFYSGFGANVVQGVRQLGVALGMDPNLAASMENFQSMSNQLVKDRLGSLGTGVSNADVSFIGRTVPTLEATPQGNKQLLDILEKLADRDIEVARVAQQYAKDHGGGTRLDQNWSSYLADWAKTHPLFDSGGGSRSVDDLVKQYTP